MSASDKNRWKRLETLSGKWEPSIVFLPFCRILGFNWFAETRDLEANQFDANKNQMRKLSLRHVVTRQFKGDSNQREKKQLLPRMFNYCEILAIPIIAMRRGKNSRIWNILIPRDSK